MNDTDDIWNASRPVHEIHLSLTAFLAGRLSEFADEAEAARAWLEHIARDGWVFVRTVRYCRHEQ